MNLNAIVRYIIAATIALSTVIVLAAKGVTAMPFDWIGVVGALLFIAAALAMTRVH